MTRYTGHLRINIRRRCPSDGALGAKEAFAEIIEPHDIASLVHRFVANRVAQLAHTDSAVQAATEMLQSHSLNLNNGHENGVTQVAHSANR